ncbi:hypothetical protein DFJ58DRAFT_723272 [Suillus subalutaceus]|uniref:uncharacterized protein n=1 Tax=Suillus subalutaceus TaxID=48586 RepID=UPI001B85EF93|nr:uncharacterized protein DFJ58DRAFT_723272 [Suillus subalutaceus]KAG1869423.1 hypothetical protein DFJ58DRAFT_723272 [Suillus subalutaceus]
MPTPKCSPLSGPSTIAADHPFVISGRLFFTTGTSYESLIAHFRLDDFGGIGGLCFSIDVLKTTLDLVKDVDGHCQYLNYHGQQGVRPSRDQTVHGDSYEEQSMITFNVPYEHVRSLHKFYVDSIVNQLDWHTFVQKLNAEIQDFNLLATVLGPDMIDIAQARLESLVHPKHGLETLAIIYSLPYALLT